MSSEASAWVFQRSKHSGGALLVFLSIANHCHPDGTGAWPSLDTLAAYSRMSKRGIQYIIERLEESGELKVVRTKRKGVSEVWTGRNEYIIPGVVEDGFYATRKPFEEDGSSIFPDAKIAPRNRVGRKSGEDEVHIGRRLDEDEVQIEVRAIPNPKEHKPKPKTVADSVSFNYSTFQSRYYSLTGTTPSKAQFLVTKYSELCAKYSEDAVLDLLPTWVDGQGGGKSLRGNKYGPGNFLEQVEIMLTTERVSDSDRKEASYAHGTESNFDYEEYHKRFPPKE